MRHVRRTPRRGGWLLIEILVLLALFALFLLIEAQLFVGIVRVWSGSRRVETQVAQFDSAFRQLRQDVWSARGVEVSDGGRRLLVRTGGGEVVWDAAPPLTRTAADDTKSWPDVGQSLTFAVDGPVVGVRTRSATGEEAGLIVTSQVLLAEAAR